MVIDDERERVGPTHRLPGDRLFDRNTNEIPADLRDWYQQWQTTLAACLHLLEMVTEPDDLTLAIATAEMVRQAPEHIEVFEPPFRHRLFAEQMGGRLKAAQAALALPTRAEQIEKLKSAARSIQEGPNVAALALARYGEEVMPFLIEIRSWAGLRALGPPAVPAMMKLLKGLNDKDIELAGQVLGPARHRPAIERLVADLLTVKESHTQPAQVAALLYFGSDGSAALLEKLRDDGPFSQSAWA